MRGFVYIIIGLVGLGYLTSACNTRTTSTYENNYASTKTFELAAPLIEVSQSLFTDSTLLRIKPSHPTATILYSIDRPISESDSGMVYNAGVYLKNSHEIYAYVSHPDFKKSETVSTAVFKINHSLEQADIRISPPAHPSYAGLGPKSLTDQLKGSMSFRNSNAWLGFDHPKVRIQLDLKQDMLLEQISFSGLIDTPSWIFGPKEIRVFSKGKLLNKIDFKEESSGHKSQLKSFVVGIPKDRYRQFTMEIQTVSEIPNWHEGKGSQGWLFLDQILVN
jgi:hypothetical protein